MLNNDSKKASIQVLKRDFQRGDGEFLGFTIGMVGLAFMILMIVGIFQLCMATSQLENAIDLISRDIVTCESLDDAKDKANTEAQTLLSGYHAIKSDSVEADVYYAPGSDSDHREWVKGNFVEVSITVKLTVKNPFVNKLRTVTALVMIEKNA